MTLATVSAAPALGATAGASPTSGPFAGLASAPAPTGWSQFDVPVPPAIVTIAFPPSFTPIGGDRGTVSAAVRDDTGRVRAYLNVTPRQGDERQRGFAAFRVHILAGEHDQSVNLEARAEGVTFGGGRGSCLLDDYVTRLGHYHYRELACFVEGHGAGAVVVAAATVDAWSRYEPLLRQAVASLAVS
jgi:hypothetical protein